MGRRWLWRNAGAGVCCLGLMMGAASVYAQGLVVKPNEAVTFAVNMDFDCADLVVQGELTAPGVVFKRVGNVIIGPNGRLLASNATIEVTTSWQNGGQITAPGSSVTASNACANTGTTFSGSTEFSHLSSTTAGHQLQFAAGSEQTVTGSLQLDGVTLTGQGGPAYLTLPAGGAQSIAAVGVNNVDASRGQHLAPTLSNAVQGTATNWFKATPPKPVTPTDARAVPVNSPAGLALLAGLMLAAAHRVRRWRGKSA